jgi:hypothetical protein
MLHPPPVDVVPLLLPELLWLDPLLLALASPALPEKNVSCVPLQAPTKATPTAPSTTQEARFKFMCTSPEDKSADGVGKISRRW